MFYHKQRNFSVLARRCTSTMTFQARQHFCHLRTVSGLEGALCACPRALSALGSSQRLRKCWGQLCVHSLSTQGLTSPPIGTPANLLAPASPFFGGSVQLIMIPVSSAAVKMCAHNTYAVGFSHSGKDNKPHFCFDQLLSSGTNRGMVSFEERFCSRSGRCGTGCRALDHRASETKEVFRQQAASGERQRGGWDL